MSEPRSDQGMGVATATRIEFFIIGLGVLALVLIFQPFSLPLFGIGCVLVFLAAMANNLLPLCEPSVRARTVVKVALIIAVIFVVVVALSIGAAWLYGRYFVG